MSELLDNSRHRIETLKGIIRQLHDGADPDQVKDEFGALLAEVGVTEIAAMENSLMAEGMEQAEIQRMCDVHAAVLGGGRSCAPVDVPTGHPVQTFQLENAKIRELTGTYRAAVNAIGSSTDDLDLVLAAWRQAHDELTGIEVHYLRKEYLVFPFLEKAGIAGPPKVMWGVHDEIRGKIAAATDLLDNAGELDAEQLGLVVETVLEPMLEQIESMTSKEDRILWPMCLEHLAVRDWESVRGQWDEFGKGLVEPAGIWLPVLPQLPEQPVELPSDGAITLPSGHLSVRQLTALLNTLPMDITYVDADDRVAYFSEGTDRVFARNRAIIGRKVEDCHPPKSVHIVERVVSDLKSGKRDVAEFWIQMGPRFVHIRYFAMRDEDGEFLGTLEVTQDIAPLRALEGERRLLAEAPGEGAGV